jgi:hypothetical protein
MTSQLRATPRRRGALQLAAAALGLWLAALPGIGSAQRPPSAAERETARALMQEGDRLTASGDLRTALARYTAAHALVHLPTTGLEVARAESKLGHLVEARGLALEISNGVAEPNEPRFFAAARAEAGKLARELEPRIPSLRTVVTPANTDYTLTIDGITLPHAARDIAFRTNPGQHIVIVEARGYATLRKELTLPEKQAATFNVALVPNAPRAAAAPAPASAPGQPGQPAQRVVDR